MDSNINVEVKNYYPIIQLLILPSLFNCRVLSGAQLLALF